MSVVRSICVVIVLGAVLAGCVGERDSATRINARASSMQPPRWFSVEYLASVETGIKNGRALARTKDVSSDTVATVISCPSHGSNIREFNLLKKIARARSNNETKRAQYLDKRGRYAYWESASTTNPLKQQLRAAQDMVVAATTRAKQVCTRTRPYLFRPGLPIVLESPGENPSFPSGHTSDSITSSVVLASGQPERRNELYRRALEMGWSRVYGGVHYPSDVYAGARLGAAVAALSLARDGIGITQPPELSALRVR